MSFFHFRSRLLYRGFFSGSVFIDYLVEMGHTQALFCPARKITSVILEQRPVLADRFAL